MADFCRQCTQQRMGVDYSDFEGITTQKDTDNQRYARVLCEGCGIILVDHTGSRVGSYIADFDKLSNIVTKSDTPKNNTEKDAFTTGSDIDISALKYPDAGIVDYD